MNIAPINNMTKLNINKGMFSSILLLVMFDSLYYICACGRTEDNWNYMRMRDSFTRSVHYESCARVFSSY